MAARTGGSPHCDSGTGEAVVWFDPVDAQRVDTIIVVAQESSGRAAAQTSMSVQLEWTGQPSSTTRTRPDWTQRGMQTEPARLSGSPGYTFMEGPAGWIVGGIGLLMMAAVPGYFALQLWLLWSARGKWRKAAALPLVLMIPVLVYTVIAFAQGSNLFPIVMIFTAPLGFLYLLVLAVVRRGANKTATPSSVSPS